MTKELDRSALEKCLGRQDVPVFAAGIDHARRERLTLHTTRRNGHQSLQKAVQEELHKQGLNVACKIKVHPTEKLEREQSVESLVQRFAHDELVYDPTQSIGRAGILVRCAASIRAQLGEQVGGVYFSPVQRTVYVVLRWGKVANKDGVHVEQMRTIENRLAQAIFESIPAADRFLAAVRIGFTSPGVALVPIDEMAYDFAASKNTLRRIMKSGSAVAAVAAMLGLGLTTPASASDEPAVSGFNGKLGVRGGSWNSNGLEAVEGSFTAPISDLFGVQIDGLAGQTHGDTLWGAGGHFFWRDPEIALVGATYAHLRKGNTEVSRTGLESEVYLGDFTVGARTGYQWGDARHSTYVDLDLRWYPIDNVMLQVGSQMVAGQYAGSVDVEYQPGFDAVPGLAFFGGGAYGEDMGHKYGSEDYSRIDVGVRYYFGSNKSLKDRHRKDDPQSLFSSLEFPLSQKKVKHRGYGGPK